MLLICLAVDVTALWGVSLYKLLVVRSHVSWDAQWIRAVGKSNGSDPFLHMQGSDGNL